LQVNVGEIFGKVALISLNDLVSLTVDNRTVIVEVVGITRASSQSDSELILPLETVNALLGKNGTVSFVEFAPKDPVAGGELVGRVQGLLSVDAKVVKIQQLDTFVADMNGQVVSFLALWSLVIYVVVVAASYIGALRLVEEANYELSMLKTLGAKRRSVFEIVLVHSLFVGLVGAVFGLALGLVGAQMFSSVLRWVWAGVPVSPFLEVGQVLQIIVLALVSSFVGCIYPALKTSFKTNGENEL
jgi:lipoprotein-releasing system permease protein